MTKHCVINAYRQCAGYVPHIPNLGSRMEVSKTDNSIIFSHIFFCAKVDPVAG
jgi:hypothetical protein